VMEPVTSTLDILQRDKHCFLGMVLPKLVQLHHSLTRVMNSNLVYCEPLGLAIVNGLPKRYGGLLERQMPATAHATVAAVSHPLFKLRWVLPSKRESIHAMFVQCVESCSAADGASQETATSGTDDDYGFNEHSTDIIRVNSTEAEVSAYLSDSEQSLVSLLKYPAVQ